jgi:hypothetical protein
MSYDEPFAQFSNCSNSTLVYTYTILYVCDFKYPSVIMLRVIAIWSRGTLLRRSKCVCVCVYRRPPGRVWGGYTRTRRVWNDTALYGQVNNIFSTDLLRFSRFIIPFSIDGITVSLYYKCVQKFILRLSDWIITIFYYLP